MESYICMESYRAPAGVTGTAPTVQGGNDGKLNGVNPSMEYSTNKDFTDAKDCTGNEVTGIPPCTVGAVPVTPAGAPGPSFLDTVTVNSFTKLPSLVVAVMVAVPGL